jgi:hypothetical protein
LRLILLILIFLISSCSGESKVVSTCEDRDEYFSIESREDSKLKLRAVFDRYGGVSFVAPNEIKSASDIRSNQKFSFNKSEEYLIIKFRKNTRKIHGIKNHCVSDLKKYFLKNNIHVSIGGNGN